MDTGTLSHGFAELASRVAQESSGTWTRLVAGRCRKNQAKIPIVKSGPFKSIVLTFAPVMFSQGQLDLRQRFHLGSQPDLRSRSGNLRYQLVDILQLFECRPVLVPPPPP